MGQIELSVVCLVRPQMLEVDITHYGSRCWLLAAVSAEGAYISLVRVC